MPKSLSIAQQIRSAIKAKDKSLTYGAALVVSEHLGIPLKTASSRLRCLTNEKAPETIVILERLCEALGLEIVIQPIESPKE